MQIFSEYSGHALRRAARWFRAALAGGLVALVLELSSVGLATAQTACDPLDEAAEQAVSDVIQALNKELFGRVAVNLEAPQVPRIVQTRAVKAVERHIQGRGRAGIHVIDRRGRERIEDEFRRHRPEAAAGLSADLQANFLALVELDPIGPDKYRLELRVVDLEPGSVGDYISSGLAPPCFALPETRHNLFQAAAKLAGELREDLARDGFVLAPSAVIHLRGQQSPVRRTLAGRLRNSLEEPANTRVGAHPIVRADLRLELSAEADATLVTASLDFTTRDHGRRQVNAWTLLDEAYRGATVTYETKIPLVAGHGVDRQLAGTLALWLARADLVDQALGIAPEAALAPEPTPIDENTLDLLAAALRRLERAVTVDEEVEIEDDHLHLSAGVVQLAHRHPPPVLRLASTRILLGQAVTPEIRLEQYGRAAVYGLTSDDRVLRIYASSDPLQAFEFRSILGGRQLRYHALEDGRTREFGAFLSLFHASDTLIANLAEQAGDNRATNRSEAIPMADFLAGLAERPEIALAVTAFEVQAP